MKSISSLAKKVFVFFLNISTLNVFLTYASLTYFHNKFFLAPNYLCNGFYSGDSSIDEYTDTKDNVLINFLKK